MIIQFQTIKRLNTERENSYKELDKRITREKELAIVQRKMEMVKVLKEKRKLVPKRLHKGTKTAAPVIQFQFERKK